MMERPTTLQEIAERVLSGRYARSGDCPDRLARAVKAVYDRHWNDGGECPTCEESYPCTEIRNMEEAAPAPSQAPQDPAGAPKTGRAGPVRLEEYDIATYGGKRRVRGYRVSEYFAVRREPGFGQWQIDHIPSGMMVPRSFRTRRIAAACAQILEADRGDAWNFTSTALSVSEFRRRTHGNLTAAFMDAVIAGEITEAELLAGAPKTA